MSEQRMLKITLMRSPIGQTERQRATLRGLGLTRVGKTVLRNDTAPVRGMIGKVLHLVKLEG
jgi:large subunit ribosomal protein L30